MHHKLDKILGKERQEIIDFAAQLVKIESLSGQEEAAVRAAARRMTVLGYEDVTIDTMGNVCGRVGRGPKTIVLDAHLDTVDVQDHDSWQFPPFGGTISDDKQYGRGAADMKGGAAAALYAGFLADRLGLLEGKSLYFTGTVCEENCDGENLKHLFQALNLKPDYYITCEPSENQIVTGHKGKAQVSLKTRGKSAHGSAPEKGENAVYAMAEIIRRVEETARSLRPKGGRKPTLVLSRISSQAVSLNAVPFSCEIYLDRRLAPGESRAEIHAEMDALVAGENACWEIGVVQAQSWQGTAISYQPFHLAWEIAKDHPLALSCARAYQEAFGKEPLYDYWDFSTNAVTPVSMGIPSIGFGPGSAKLAHCRDEYCPVGEIIEACRFYCHLAAIL